MRRALRANPNKIPPSLTAAVSAPTKGWYSQESFVEQDPESAIILENAVAEPDSIRIRRGYTSHATGMSGEIQSLLIYSSSTPATKMFAANANSIYDVSSAGAVGAADVTGTTNNKWQQTMFATSAGQFLVIANGADAVYVYNGAGWSNPAITGADPTLLVQPLAHKQRLWFVQVNSTSLWYLSTSSIAGAATEFPVGAYMHKGGYIQAIGTWSVDAGDGMDDMFVVVTSEGEVLVYQGTDPTSANTWALIGNYHVGDPIGRRCVLEVGGDIAILTEDGVIPLSKALKLDRAAMVSEALTKNIRKAYAKATQRSGSVFGWELVSHPTKNIGVLNVPGTGTFETEQYIVSTLTGAWSKWTNIDAKCWAHFDGDLYFGSTDGKVYQADYGANDNGEAIAFRMLPAYNHLEKRGRQKHVKMVKPIYISDVDLIPSVSIAVDYEDPEATATSQDIEGAFFTWDVSAWDEAPWRGEAVSIHWRGGSNIGEVVAPFWALDLDATETGAEFTFEIWGTNLVFEVGGVL